MKKPRAVLPRIGSAALALLAFNSHSDILPIKIRCEIRFEVSEGARRKS